ncbi:hypothetical protein BVRB_5g105570 isoform B [Beta vulgaris subsp. vulgaris]|nr:hypothetical protein BVRB_5g105570 isoform B [Beta vulgaris subsp. vulgaris]
MEADSRIKSFGEGGYEKATSKVSKKASKRASLGVSSGSKKRAEVMTEDPLLAFEEPPQKRSRVDQLGTNMPFTSITRPQKLARMKSVVQAIYTDADDEALLNLGRGEINALYESWLETSLRMISITNHRSQFEEGVSTLAKEVAFVGFITGTTFLRTRLHATDVTYGNLYLNCLYYGVVHMMFNGLSELSLMITRLPVFYKQRDNCFYPAWAWSLSSWLLRVPYSVLESVVWTCVVYYTVGFAPATERSFYARIQAFLEREIPIFLIHADTQKLSELHQLMLEAAEILNIEPPDLYVRQNPAPNAYTLAISGKRPFVVVHTSLI